MAETSRISAPDEVWNGLGGLTKLVTAVAACAYAAGVIAINTYLHGLGIVDFSFAKPKLLLTGIVVLFSYLLLTFPSFFLAWSIATNQGGIERRLPPLKLVLTWLFVSLMLLLAACMFSCFQTHPGMGQSTVWAAWKFLKPGHTDSITSQIPKRLLMSLIVAAGVYLPIFVAAVSVYAATRLFDQERAEQPTPRISLRRFFLAIAAAVFVVSTIGYICMFTATFYSIIPQEFGGGKPYFQSFVIAPDDLRLLQQLEIPFDCAHPSVTQPLPILHETDTLVAVWLNDAPEASKSSWNFVVVELDRKLINATKIDADSTEPVPRLSAQPCSG
jgi:hypothetical protein